MTHWWLVWILHAFIALKPTIKYVWLHRDSVYAVVQVPCSIFTTQSQQKLVNVYFAICFTSSLCCKNQSYSAPHSTDLLSSTITSHSLQLLVTHNSTTQFTTFLSLTSAPHSLKLSCHTRQHRTVYTYSPLCSAKLTTTYTLVQWPQMCKRQTHYITQ